MRRVIMWDMVSVDGFFEAPGHDIGWFVFEDELAAYIGERNSKRTLCSSAA